MHYYVHVVYNMCQVQYSCHWTEGEGALVTGMSSRASIATTGTSPMTAEVSPQSKAEGVLTFDYQRAPLHAWLICY